ncbi:MAG: histidine kinase [Burkholderiales bacterium]|nr:histidine kinase [Burkholderiales bacterium]
MSIFGNFSVVMFLFFLLHFEPTARWSLSAVLVASFAFFCFQAVSAWVNAKRQLKVFLSNRWELTEELISPVVTREFVSPLDPITTFDLCADAVSSITIAQMLGSTKGLHFSYDPFKGTISLARSTPAFLNLAVCIEIQMQQGQVTTVKLQSKPGWTRFFLQNGDAYQWVTKVTKHLQERLQQKRCALDAAKREAALEKAALESQLAALQAQVEPHFLFNTLANLNYLIRTDATLAQELLAHLVGYLQTAMPDLRSISSNVGKELELVEHFLHIMQMRMGRRLQFALTCEEPVRAMAMPPAMLISLVENAIKHGLEKATRAGRIDISARSEQDKIVIDVVDDGVGLQDNAGQGVGLANIHQRLALLYGNAASIEIMPGKSQGVLARISFPKPSVSN